MNEEDTRPHVIWEGKYNSHKARVVQSGNEVYIEVLSSKDQLGNPQWESYTISGDVRIYGLGLRHLILQLCGVYKEE